MAHDANIADRIRDQWKNEQGSEGYHGQLAAVTAEGLHLDYKELGIALDADTLAYLSDGVRAIVAELMRNPTVSPGVVEGFWVMGWSMGLLSGRLADDRGDRG